MSQRRGVCLRAGARSAPSRVAPAKRFKSTTDKRSTTTKTLLRPTLVIASALFFFFFPPPYPQNINCLTPFPKPKQVRCMSMAIARIAQRRLASSFTRPLLASSASPLAVAGSRLHRSPAAPRFTSTMSDQTIIFTKDAPARTSLCSVFLYPYLRSLANLPLPRF